MIKKCYWNTIFMILDRSAKRQGIDDILDAMPRDWDKVGTLDGISILEKRDSEYDRRWAYTCAEYVFKHRQPEPWFSIFMDDTGMWFDTENFMVSKGYEVIAEPEEHSIVAYVGYDPEKKKRMKTMHWGIFCDGRVESKFGVGHAYQHDVDMVPNSYGAQALFFRKSK